MTTGVWGSISQRNCQINLGFRRKRKTILFVRPNRVERVCRGHIGEWVRKSQEWYERGRHTAGHKKGVCCTVQLPPLQPQLLYILNLFMYKCLSPLLRAGPTESPKSLWKGDTINSLSRHSLFMLTMLVATQCNFGCVKYVQLKIEDKRTWGLKWIVFSMSQKIYVWEFTLHWIPMLENIPVIQRWHYSHIIPLYGSTEMVQLLYGLFLQATVLWMWTWNNMENNIFLDRFIQCILHRLCKLQCNAAVY